MARQLAAQRERELEHARACVRERQQREAAAAAARFELERIRQQEESERNSRAERARLDAARERAITEARERQQWAEKQIREEEARLLREEKEAKITREEEEHRLSEARERMREEAARLRLAQVEQRARELEQQRAADEARLQRDRDDVRRQADELERLRSDLERQRISPSPQPPTPQRESSSVSVYSTPEAALGSPYASVARTASVSSSFADDCDPEEASRTLRPSASAASDGPATPPPVRAGSRPAVATPDRTISRTPSSPSTTAAFRVRASELAFAMDADSRLGEGSFSVVYRGTYRGEPVAVKVLKTGGALRRADVTMFWKEAEVTYVNHHEHLVRCHGVLVDEAAAPPVYAIVMELCEHTLEDVLETADPPLETPGLVRLLKQVAHALKFLHAGGIAHQDVKPSNVLITRAGQARLSDLGLAKVRNSTMRSSTVSGAQPVGTIMYMDPALCEFDPACAAKTGAPCDVYSFGIMAWEVLSGTQPYGDLGIPAAALQQQIIAGLRPDLAALGDDVPESLRELLPRCWAKKQADRLSMAQVLEVLSSALEGLQGSDCA